MAKLIGRLGVNVLHAPALSEVPDVDRTQLRQWLERWRTLDDPLIIFQTGVGVEILSTTFEELGLFDEFCALLGRSTVAVRGPKPSAALRKRQIRIDHAALTPFTSQTLMQALHEVPLGQRAVFVQRHGGGNPELLDALTAQGAQVTEISAYRWGLPVDTSGMDTLLEALRKGTVSTLVVTSASQMQNLMDYARSVEAFDATLKALAGVNVLSVGPVSSAAVRQWGIQVAGEASPPKLGPLMALLEDNLQARSLLS
jgi:uroporphyrinogen-III synthase